jgi:iron complex transport system permease protein
VGVIDREAFSCVCKVKLMKLALSPKTIAQQNKKRIPASFMLPFLSCLLLVVICVAVSFGSTAIPIGTVAQVLLNGTHIFHFPPSKDGTTEIIIWQVRMPLVIGAALVGAALGVAGVLFQGMLRNPLADPYLLGTSSGAALGASIAFILPIDTFANFFFPLTALLAFVGAMVTVLLVYAIARTGGQTPVVTLVLAGVVVNAVLVACQTLILTLRPPGQVAVYQSLFNWLSGGVSVASWASLFVVALCIVAGLVAAFALAGVLDVFALGEEGAAHLGLHVEWYKFMIVIVASLLTAAAVSISGLIGFVGLVIPHLMRLLLGPRHRVLVLASALGGATFLVLADLLARSLLAGTILPVGIFTAFIGAPFFLFLLRRSKRGYRW